MKIREYRQSDLNEILKLFHDTIHNVNIKDYNKEQVDAWAPKIIDKQRWLNSLDKNYSIVVVLNNKIVGFGDLESDGYLNRLYVHKDYQHKGVGKIIVNNLENYAKQRNIEKLITEASITAKPFFEQLGYSVIKEQNKFHNGVYFINYIMSKYI